MPVCAACRHVQASGTACELCGGPFAAPMAAAPRPASLQGPSEFGPGRAPASLPRPRPSAVPVGPPPVLAPATPSLPAEWGPPEKAEAESMPGFEPTALGAAGIAAPADRLPELESTAIVDGSIDVPAGRLPDLDTVHADPIDLPAVAAMPDLDRHHADAVPALPPDGAVALEPTHLATPGASTPPSATMTCRECDHEQASGPFCESCGYKLPVARATERVAAAEVLLCESCGAPATPGSRCRNCGDRVRTPGGMM